MKSHIEALQKEVDELGVLVQAQGKQIRALQQQQPHVAQAEDSSSAPKKPAHTVEFSQPKKKTSEEVFGMYYLSKIGMIGLLIGIAFLLKYSFDNNLIGPLGRILIGYGFGIVFFVIGELYRKKYVHWSRVFTGGSLAVLYFATYAAQHYYGMFSLPVTIFIMSLITVFGATVSVIYKSKMVFAFAAVCGLLTPLLIAGDVQAEAVLRLYYVATLNVGILFVARYMRWYAFDGIGSIGVLLYFSLLQSSLSFGYAIGFLLFFYAEFTISLILRAWQDREGKEVIGPEKLNASRSALVTSGLFQVSFFYGFLYILVDASDHAVLALVGFVLALVYAGAARILRAFPSLVYLSYTCGAAAVGLAVAAIAIMFDSQFIAPLWAMFGLVIVYGAAEKHDAVFRNIGTIVASIAALRILPLLFTDDLHIMSADFLTILIPILVLFFVSALYGKVREDIHNADMVGTLFVSANILFVGLIWVTIFGTLPRVYHQSADLLVSLFLAVYSLIWLVAGFVKHKKLLRMTGLVGFVFTILKLLLNDLSELDSIFRVVVFIAVGVALILASYLYQHAEKKED